MFPVSNQKYQKALDDLKAVTEQFDATAKELESLKTDFATATKHAADLALEVQQLTEKVASEPQSQIDDLNKQLSEANTSIADLETNLDNSKNELTKSQSRVVELEKSIAALRSSSVDPSRKVVTSNDANNSGTENPDKFFEENQDDVNLCVQKFFELGYV